VDGAGKSFLKEQVGIESSALLNAHIMGDQNED